MQHLPAWVASYTKWGNEKRSLSGKSEPSPSLWLKVIRRLQFARPRRSRRTRATYRFHHHDTDRRALRGLGKLESGKAWQYRWCRGPGSQHACVRVQPLLGGLTQNRCERAKGFEPATSWSRNAGPKNSNALFGVAWRPDDDSSLTQIVP